ncbi:MAG: hypothetical protein LBH59_05955 [Planctomycetaceae bacterium]|jgi:hypothetical protein|nr:hypothetical protein [Planctomycetaceae bacterium]
MLTYYYILAQNYTKDFFKKLHNNQRGDAIQTTLIVGIAVIILGAVLFGGKKIWKIVSENAMQLIGG